MIKIDVRCFCWQVSFRWPSLTRAGTMSNPDSDGDGLVSEQEFNKAREDAWPPLAHRAANDGPPAFTDLDADRDGFVSGRS